jgi:branched-chain amino acid aminotransferase
MQSTNYAYVNGRFVPENEATVSIFDRGFLYGDGVFETMRVYGGKAFRARAHIDRLIRGLKELEINFRTPAEELKVIGEELTERNGVTNGIARVYVTSGESVFGCPSRTQDAPTTVVVVKSFAFETNPAAFHVIVSSVRLDVNSQLPRLKTANRLPYILARHEAKRANADEALLRNTNDHVIELTISNLFVVKNGELFTPPLDDGPLPGITRHVVLVLAGAICLPTHEISFGVDFLNDADEMFATNSLIEIVSIVGFNGRAIPQGTITARLQQVYQKLVREELGL